MLVNKGKKHTANPNKWIDNYADYLFYYAKSRVSDTDIAKDLMQETFYAGIKGLDNFKGDCSEKTWLTSILKRKVVDQYRKMNSKKEKAFVSMPFYSDGENKGNWIEERAPNSIESSNKIENEELGQALKKCIGGLPQKNRMVFEMKTLHNISTEEICKDLEISSSNLWVIIHRARVQLRACMEKNWFK